MNWTIIIIEAIVMTIAFTAVILISLVKNLVWWIHDYPKDIQEEYFKTHERVPTGCFSKPVLIKKGFALIFVILKEGDGFGIRYAYKLDEIHGENGEQLVHTLIREIAGDYDYSETRIRKVLQDLGVRPENLLGPNLATQLKRMHDDDVVVSRLGRTRGYKTNKNNGGKSSTNDKRGIRQTKENFFITPQGEVYGFAAPNGELYFDETVISHNHPLHECTHLWDRALPQ